MVLFLLLFFFSSSALACRYNIRELGFVDEGQPRFDLTVFVHSDEQNAWLPEFQSSAQSILGRSNVTWNVLDEVKNPEAPELRDRAQLGPRLPGAMLHFEGHEEGWPMYLHFTGQELAAKLKTLVASGARAQMTAAMIDTYGAVLLLRSTSEPANAIAKEMAQHAIKAIEMTLAELPKRISLGPRLIEVDPSLPDEQVIAWALGVNGKDLAQPVVAVAYGRGRLAGSALHGTTLTAANIEGQLGIIGADCECTMDHTWMKAGSLPIVFSPSDETRLTPALGFDPAAPSVKAEVSQILASQARIAADPSALRGSGYRETPIETVTISPRPQTVVASQEVKDDHTKIWWFVGGGLLLLIVIFALAKKSKVS